MSPDGVYQRYKIGTEPAPDASAFLPGSASG